MTKLKNSGFRPWLSGSKWFWSMVPGPKGLRVQSLVRAHAGNNKLMCFSLSLSPLPPFLLSKINKNVSLSKGYNKFKEKWCFCMTEDWFLNG